MNLALKQNLNKVLNKNLLRNWRQKANVHVMNSKALEAVHHIPSFPYSYAHDKETLHIFLRTNKNVETVSIVYGDFYDCENGNEIWPHASQLMESRGQDDFFEYWFAPVSPKHRRCKYLFDLSHASEEIYYCEDGFQYSKKDALITAFNFPFLHEIDVFSPPKWVSKTVWYQIFPERFGNGDEKLNPKGVMKWGEEPTRNNFFGGDFQGIIDHVDHLVDLGITGIYMTPIFKAHSNHKYDTIDYMELDPQFGTKETFKKMIQILHKNNIRIMLDAVFNHSGEHFEPFVELKKEGENSKYKDWFFVKSFPITYTPRPNYDCFGFFGQMPKLNTSNKEVKDYLLKVVEYWTKEFDIDGWRLDVANEIDHSFWREFRNHVKTINPDIFILGEVWSNGSKWLLGDQFDSIMNYPLQKAVLQFFCSDNTLPSTFAEKITKLRHWYSENVNKVQFNLLSSHDTARIFTECKNNADIFKLISTFHFTYIGTPCIYYGDEIAMTGKNDPDCRKCMEWDKAKQNKSVYQFMKKLIAIRKKYTEIFEGDFRLIDANDKDNSLIYLRNSKSQSALVIINKNNEKLVLNKEIVSKVSDIYPLRLLDAFTDEIHEQFPPIEPFSANIFIF